MTDLQFDFEQAGERMYSWVSSVFPLNRSLTGIDTFKTLKSARAYANENISIKHIESGTSVYDWIIPPEWNLKRAYIKDSKGNIIIDSSVSNLHVVGYSIPFTGRLSFAELEKHLHYLPDQKQAIPYVTSYYKRTWGFCLSFDQFKSLDRNEEYYVKIDSELKEDGRMHYGEFLKKGEIDEEILISSYICHPSMANNELSGPSVVCELINWLSQIDTRYSYRVLLVPETIGAIAYLNLNESIIKERVINSLVITCVGDEDRFSLMKSKYGDTLFDEIGNYVIKHVSEGEFKTYSYLERGSDERQYSSVPFNIPSISLMRSKYGIYKEYHTSLDDLNFVTAKGLSKGLEMNLKYLYFLENNYKLLTSTACEPMLGKRNLYEGISIKNTMYRSKDLLNIIAYADGSNDLIGIAKYCQMDYDTLFSCLKTLFKHQLIERVND